MSIQFTASFWLVRSCRVSWCILLTVGHLHLTKAPLYQPKRSPSFQEELCLSANCFQGSWCAHFAHQLFKLKLHLALCPGLHCTGTVCYCDLIIGSFPITAKWLLFAVWFAIRCSATGVSILQSQSNHLFAVASDGQTWVSEFVHGSLTLEQSFTPYFLS